jgi:hypothetical protein
MANERTIEIENRNTVQGIAFTRRSDTGSPYQTDLPRSPWKTEVMYEMYCFQRGWSTCTFRYASEIRRNVAWSN